MALVDGGKRSSQIGAYDTGEPIGDTGRYQKEEDRQRNTKPRSYGFWEEGVDTIRQDEHHLGDGVSEGAHRLKC